MKSETPSPVIRLDDVHVTLSSKAGPVHILRGVSLDVSAGGSLAIVGPSGSGKTTLMMTMAGLERVTSGKVLLSGSDLGTLDEDALALLRGDTIGIVFQSFHLVPSMTAIENVALPLEFLGRDAPFERAADALNEVGLGDRIDHFPTELSGGERQRVGLARALVTRPKILLADEPTGNLDSRTGQAVMDLMFDLHERTGATLVLITHDDRLATRCERVMRMDDGLIAEADVEREAVPA